MQSHMDAHIVFKTNCQRAVKAIHSDAAEPILEELISYVKSGGDTGGSYDLLFPRLFALPLGEEEAGLPFQNVILIEELFSELLTNAATDRHSAELAKELSLEFVDRCFAMFQRHSGQPQHPARRMLWKNVLHKLYKHCWGLREHMMKHMKGYLFYVAKAMVSDDMLDKFLQQLLQKQKDTVSEECLEFTAMFHTLSDLLEVLGAVIAGFRTPLAEAHVRELLVHGLLPLHSNALSLDEFRPMLSAYAQPLAFCVTQFVTLMPELTARVVPFLCGVATSAKTPPKSVPFLVSELEAVLEAMPRENYRNPEVRRALKKLVVDSVASLQFTVAQRALLFLKMPKVVRIFHEELRDITYQSLVPTLLKSGSSHWNDTTRQLCFTVLKMLGDMPDSPVLRLREYQQLLAKHKRMLAHEEQALAKKHKQMGERKANLKYFDFVYVRRGLGEGSYSQVHHVRRIDRKAEQRFWEDYAMKSMDKEQLKKEHYLEEAEREIRLLEGPLANHPNIVKLICKFEDEHRLYLILEFAEHGDVFHVLEKLGTVGPDYARFVAAETALALEHVHGQGLMHLDLKPENLLVHRSGHIRLTDFGTSLETANTAAWTLQGTAEYLSPSLVSGGKPQPQDDWWAFAMMLYQLLAGHTPFNGIDKEQLFGQIRTCDLRFDDAFPADARDLITIITSALRDGRGHEIDAAAVKAHPFFAGVAWNAINEGQAPQPAVGAKKVEEIDPNVRQRKYSMMLTNTLPKRYHFATLDLQPIPEYPEEEDEEMADAADC